MSVSQHHSHPRRGTRRLLAGGLAAALFGGVLAASATTPSASAAVKDGNEPGVTMRVYHVPYDLRELCTLKPGQTPNVDLLKPTINWTQAADFDNPDDEQPVRTEKFISHALADLEVTTAGSHTFELRSDDGSRLWIDDQLVIDHDGLHGADPKSGTVQLTAGFHKLFVEHFEAGGGEQVTLNWRKPGDTGFTLVPTSALSTPANVTRVVAPGNKECEGNQDAPGDGLQLDGVNPAYDLVDLRPAGFNPKVTGLAWEGDDLLVLTWGGTGSPTNLTSEGELYRLEGVKAADGPEDVTFTKLVDKLREPQGVAVVDVDGDGKNEYYVSEKHQLSRFVDTDGNGLLNEPKASLWTVPTSGNFHEFAFGLLHRDGKFYLNTSVSIDYGGATTNPQLAPLAPGNVQMRGNTLAIDDTTGAAEILAGGLRTPNGIGFGPEDGIFVTDNQGGWLPSSKLVHIKKDRFFEHRTTPAGPFQGNPVTKPVLWMPQNEIANSPSTPVSVPSGPFAGQLLIGDVTYGGLQRAFLEKVDGEYQGALFRGTQGLEAGINEVLMNSEGTVIVGGIGGGGNWEQAGKLTYGLQKLVPTSDVAFEMQKMEVVEGGFKITYTQPIGADTLTDLASKYTVKQWGYRPSQAYGGPKIGEQTLDVTAATASDDARTVTLQIDGLEPDKVVHLRSPRPFSSAGGETLYSTEAWYTLNSYPGYVAPEPPQGLYEQEDQQTLGSANVQTEHAGYSGSGYVGGFEAVGAGVRTPVTVAEAGTYDLNLRYANGPNPFQGTKTVTLEVNDIKRQIALPSTGTWQSYGTFRTEVELTEGANTVEIRFDQGDQGNVNLDLLTLFPQGGVRYEAEDGVLAGGASAQTEHAGYSGTGYVAGFNNQGAKVTLNVTAASEGTHPVTLGYANGPHPRPEPGPKTVTMEVNGAAKQITLPTTTDWKTWGTWTGEIPLVTGVNQVSFSYGAGDDGNVNFDYLAVEGAEPVVCDPGAGPNDDFAGDELDRCRWKTILNEDKAGYRVADGKLEIDAQVGDLSGGTTNAKNVVLQPVLGNDPSTWKAETTVSIDGTDDYLQAGLTVWGNNTNYGKVMIMRHPTQGWTTELARVTGGNLQYANAPITAGQQTDIRLRMWSDGALLRGAFSVDDGATWTEIGQGYGTNGLSNVLVGPAAYNGTGEETATFDDFTLGEPAVEPETCEPATAEEGYTMLFDGTRASMEDWEMADGGTFVRMPDCSVKSVGAFGLWWHTTPIDHAYSLKLDWMKPGDDNSGVFIGFGDPQGSSWNPVEEGHEIQIDSTDDADSTTGAIYNFKAADATARDAVINPDGEWNSYEIIVEGDHIEIWLNGTLINEYDDVDPDRMNLPSHIGLQTHGDGDDVFFRNVQIKNLDAQAPAASTVTVAADPSTVAVGESTTVTVRVSADGTTPTGQVTLRDGDREVVRTLSGATATFSLAWASPGARSLTASYSGDDSVAASTGKARVLVTPRQAGLVVRPPVVDADKQRKRGSVKVTCTYSESPCIGTVKLVSGGKTIGRASISLAGGQTATIKVALNKRARTLLARRPQAKASLVMVLDGAGRTTAKVTLRR